MDPENGRLMRFSISFEPQRPGDFIRDTIRTRELCSSSLTSCAPCARAMTAVGLTPSHTRTRGTVQLGPFFIEFFLRGLPAGLKQLPEVGK